MEESHIDVDRLASRILDRLATNQQEIDYVVAVIARGGPNAEGMRERLERLEDRRGELLDIRERLAEAISGFHSLDGSSIAALGASVDLDEDVPEGR